MEKRFCSSCGAAFEPRAQSPRQAYCSKELCQRARKSLWQKTRRRTDADYHQDQLDAQKAWSADHPLYWRDYRKAHPGYTNKNRLKQKQRNAKQRASQPEFAKSDASSPWPPPAGTYKLEELSETKEKPKRFWLVALTPVP